MMSVEMFTEPINKAGIPGKNQPFSFFLLEVHEIMIFITG